MLGKDGQHARKDRGQVDREKAGYLIKLKTISKTSGARQIGEMLNAEPSTARAASTLAVDAVTSVLRLMPRKISRRAR